jgi:predicted RNase H-like nuclease (RuvC/YqgF family)
MEMEPNALRLRFDCNIEEFLVVEFEIRLKEKMVANDAILSVELEKQKQLVEMLTDRVEKQATEYRQVLDQQRQLIERLLNRLDSAEKTIGLQNKRADELERRIDCIGSIGHPVLGHRIDSATITLHNTDAKVNEFYKLNELVLFNPSHTFKSDISNFTLSKLSIDCGSNSNWSDMQFIKKIPNLEVLNIRSQNGGGIQVTEAIETLKSTPHKIKKITFNGVTNAIGLQPYCDKNGIELIIT